MSKNVPRDQLVSYLNQYLAIHDISDSSWNGLQVEGQATVSKIAFAVDAAHDTFSQVTKLGANFLIVHHGHYWQQANPSLLAWQQARLKPLLDNGISLYASHLPLDRHPDVGNNAELLRLIGAKVTEEFSFVDGKNVSWLGELDDPILLENLVQDLNDKLSTKCRVLDFGSDQIKRLAVVTGSGGTSGFYDALVSNADVYITGDPSYIYQTAKDAGMNVIFAGHYATETLGVKALAKHLAQKYSIETTFIDVPTGY